LVNSRVAAQAKRDKGKGAGRKSGADSRSILSTGIAG
jgi:hypothetical protein